jgi:hypothetical protein
LNQVTTGGLDAYQSTVNMALANKKGRSVFTTGMMGKMSLSELMQAASHPTSQQLAAGITSEGARELLDAEVNSLASRAFSESGVNQPSALKRLLEATRGEGGIMGAAERFRKQGKTGAGALEELETGLAMVTNQPLGSRPLQFLTGALAGGGGGKAGETQGRFGTALSSTFAGLREFEKDTGRFKQAMDDVKAGLATFPDMMKGFMDSMQALNPEDAAKANMALAGLGDAMGEISKNGPDAVNVLEHVQAFIASVAAQAGVKQEIERSRGTGGRLSGGGPGRVTGNFSKGGR